MKDLFQGRHCQIGQQAVLLNKEIRHFRLPSRVDVSARHVRSSTLEIVQFRDIRQESHRAAERESNSSSPVSWSASSFLAKPNRCRSLYSSSRSGFTCKIKQTRCMKLPSSSLTRIGQRRNASLRPPSTGITCPVVRALCSPASQRIAAAQNSGVIGRLVKVRWA